MFKAIARTVNQHAVIFEVQQVEPVSGIKLGELVNVSVAPVPTSAPAPIAAPIPAPVPATATMAASVTTTKP